jgi:hypothetical protein
MKNLLKRSAAVLLCLGFVLMIVPVINSAENKAPKASLVQIVNLPTLLIPSLLPFNGTAGNAMIVATVKTPSNSKVRPTDVIQIPKVGTGD